MHYGNTAPRINDPAGQLDTAIAEVRAKLADVNRRDEQIRNDPRFMYADFDRAKARIPLAHQRQNLENQLATLQQARRNHGSSSPDEWRPASWGFVGSDH